MPAVATVPLEEIMKDLRKQENSVRVVPPGNSTGLTADHAIYEEIYEPQMLCSSRDCIYPNHPQPIFYPVFPESSAVDKKSIYCPKLNCWSLKECLLHNSRYILMHHFKTTQQALNQSWNQTNLEEVCNQPPHRFRIEIQDEVPVRQDDGTSELIRRFKKPKIERRG